MLRFWPWNQYVRIDAEVAPIKFLAAGDVLRWLPLHPLVQIAAVVDPGDLGQLFFGMRVQIASLALQCVGEKNFGGESRSGHGLLFQKLGALEESGQNSH